MVDDAQGEPESPQRRTNLVLNTLLNRKIADAETNLVLNTFETHSALTPEKRQELETHLTTLPSEGISTEARSAFQDLARQGKGLEISDKRKMEEDMRVLGGDAAVGAYDRLVELKSKSVPTDSAEWKQATEALHTILQNHPNIAVPLEHRGNGEVVSPQQPFAVPPRNERVR
jgi:hypothetical protein